MVVSGRMDCMVETKWSGPAVLYVVARDDFLHYEFNGDWWWWDDFNVHEKVEPFFDCARDEFLVQYALALQFDDHTWEEFAVLYVLVLVLPDGLPAVLT